MSYESLAEYLNLASKEAHENAVKHGFYEDVQETVDILMATNPEKAYSVDRDFILAQLAKITSEIGEAVSCIQHSMTMDGLSEELADIIIRTIDLAAFLDYEIGSQVKEKMLKNQLRPYKHGKTC